MICFPYGAIIAATSMMNRNNKEDEKRRKERAEKERLEPKLFLVVDDDGSSHVLKHGYAFELDDEENICTYNKINLDDSKSLIFANLFLSLEPSQFEKDSNLIVIRNNDDSYSIKKGLIADFNFETEEVEFSFSGIKTEKDINKLIEAIHYLVKEYMKQKAEDTNKA